MVFPVSIHEADNRGQSFGQVRNAYIRVVNQANGQEIARYDLSEDASTETAMIFGEVYRNNDATDEDFNIISDMYKRIMSEDKYLCINSQKNLTAGVFVNGERVNMQRALRDGDEVEIGDFVLRLVLND